MKNITERLDRLITVTLNPANLKDAPVNDEQVQEWIFSTKQDTDNIRLQLKEQEFCIREEKSLELFVQRCQVTITHYIDILVKYNDDLPFVFTNQQAAEKISIAYAKLLPCFEILLSFIEQYFSCYFSQDAKVPDSYLLISKMEMQHQLKMLKKTLSRKIEEKELINVVLSPIANFVRGNYTGRYNYKQLMYIKILIQELTNFSNGPKNGKAALFENLVYINFNSFPLANYYTSFLNETANKHDGIENKLEQYAYHMKQLNQLFKKPNIALVPDFPSLHEMVIDWIKNEMQFLKRKVQPPVPDETTNEEEVLEENYIKLAMSSPQLALFIRSMKETNIIENKNTSLVLRNIGKVAKTVRSEKDLFNALQSDYYKAAKDLQTIRKVKDIAIKLMNYLIKLENENK